MAPAPRSQQRPGGLAQAPTSSSKPSVRCHDPDGSGPASTRATTLEAAKALEDRRNRQLDSLRSRFTHLVSRAPRYATAVDPPARLPARSREAPLHLPWTPQLEAQLHAVAQEVGLSKAGADALVRAAHARRVPSNPGALLAQLVQLLALEGEVAPRAELLAMVAAYPGLAATSAATLAGNYRALADAIPHAQLRPLLRRAPSILTCSPFSLWSNLHALGMLLDMPAGRVAALLARAPRLLTTSPTLLRQRFDALGRYFGLAEAEVRSLVRRQPLLVASQSDTLAANAEVLLQRLGLPPHLVVRMIQKQPALLLLSGPALEAKLALYCEMLALQTPDLALLLIKQPSLLNFSPASIRAKLAHLQQLLGLQQPEVLQAARTCPALLTLAPASVAHKWRLLAQWAAAEPAWAQQLAASTPSTRALYLCFSSRRLARLSYVAQLPSAPSRWGLHRLLMMSQREALQALPAMETWLQAQELLAAGAAGGPGDA